MLSCWEMSELGSDIIDRNLSVGRRIAVMMHVGMCRHCRRYIRQLRVTSQVLGSLAMPASPADIARVMAVLPKQAGPGAEQ